jgi:hypothetical protein
MSFCTVDNREQPIYAIGSAAPRVTENVMMSFTLHARSTARWIRLHVLSQLEPRNNVLKASHSNTALKLWYLLLSERETLNRHPELASIV